MENGDNEIVEEAVAWQRAIALDDDDMDWDAFTRWLEGDPRHRAAFDDVSTIDAAIDEHRFAIRTALPREALQERPVPADHQPPASRRRWFLGTGIAAALALAIGCRSSSRQKQSRRNMQPRPVPLAASLSPMVPAWRFRPTARSVWGRDSIGSR